jgi:protein SCO1/2
MLSRKSFLIRTLYLFVLFSFALSSCSLSKPAFKGELAKPVTSAPEISLPDQHGNPFKLSDMRGQVALVFFGFTNCVDECPLAMAHMKLAREMLAERASDVQVVLVSTDPVRDTPQAMQDFLGKFDPAFLGIPGSLEDLTKIWNAYDVVVLDGGETHSSLTYVIDKQGDLRLKLDAEASPEDIASDLEILLAE